MDNCDSPCRTTVPFTDGHHHWVLNAGGQYYCKYCGDARTYGTIYDNFGEPEEVCPDCGRPMSEYNGWCDRGHRYE